MAIVPIGGILVGGVLGGGFLSWKLINGYNSILSKQVIEANKQYTYNSKKIMHIVEYLNEVSFFVQRFSNALCKTWESYNKDLTDFLKINNKYDSSNIDWGVLNNEEKLLIENVTLKTQLLYNMCKLELFKDNGRDFAEANYTEVNKLIN